MTFKTLRTLNVDTGSWKSEITIINKFNRHLKNLKSKYGNETKEA